MQLAGGHPHGRGQVATAGRPRGDLHRGPGRLEEAAGGRGPEVAVERRGAGAVKVSSGGP